MTVADAQRIVVLGHGIAALTAAESLRDNGFDGELTIVGDEPHAPYSRPALSKAALLDDDLSARRDWLQSEPSSSTSMCWHAPRNSPCGELARLQDARNMFGRAGLATVITGGVVGAVTAASFFTDLSFLRFKPAQDRVNVSPMANGNEIGARIEGVW